MFLYLSFLFIVEIFQQSRYISFAKLCILQRKNSSSSEWNYTYIEDITREGETSSSAIDRPLKERKKLNAI